MDLSTLLFSKIFFVNQPSQVSPQQRSFSCVTNTDRTSYSLVQKHREALLFDQRMTMWAQLLKPLLSPEDEPWGEGRMLLYMDLISWDGAEFSQGMRSSAPPGPDHHKERSVSNRGTLPPSWIECYEQSLCTHPWAEVVVQPFHPRNWFEVLGIRPLHTAPFKQVKLDEAQRKRKRLDSILLPRSIFTGWELFVGFACDKSLFCLLSCSSFLGVLRGTGPPSAFCWFRAMSYPWVEEQNFSAAFRYIWGSPDLSPDCWYAWATIFCPTFAVSLVAQTVKNSPAVQETLVGSLGQEDSLEEGMVTHSSILAWKKPWTEEPGRL